MREPDSGAALLVIVAIIAGQVWLDSPYSQLSLTLLGLTLLLNRDFRKFLRHLVRALFTTALLVTLVLVGRVAGGTPLEMIASQYLERFTIFAATMVCASVAVSVPRRSHVILALDRLKVPRSVSYVLLSVLALGSFTAELGSRQLYFLKQKRLLRRTLISRFRAYHRLSGPLFLVLLKHQATHARSLTDRKFFTAPKHQHSALPRPNGSTVAWFLIYSIILLLCLIAQGR